MKYLLHFTIFVIGTIDFLLAWYFMEKVLSSFIENYLIVTTISFTIGLIIGWLTDFLLTMLLPAKYR